MATTPEYGAELFMDEVEAEKVDESSHGPLPRWEDLGEAEVAEQRQAEEYTHHPDFENHELRPFGATCNRCGAVIGVSEEARRTVGDKWVHVVCK